MDGAATRAQASWFQATARQRVDGLLDPGSFTESPARRNGCKARTSPCSTCRRRLTTAW